MSLKLRFVMQTRSSNDPNNNNNNNVSYGYGVLGLRNAPISNLVGGMASDWFTPPGVCP